MYNVVQNSPVAFSSGCHALKTLLQRLSLRAIALERIRGIFPLALIYIFQSYTPLVQGYILFT